MPIYEYRCTSCGHELEALQKLSDAPLTECPACHHAALQKKVSAAGFQLKGSGWYVTDFRNKDTKKPAKDGAKPADKAADGASDAKPSDAKAPAATTSESATTSQSGSASEAKSTTPSTADKS